MDIKKDKKKYVNRMGGLLLASVCTVFAAPATAVTVDYAATGGINSTGTANLTNISYGGVNPDLVALASLGNGTQTSTFQFATPTSLTDLFTTSSSTTQTSFSGSNSAVPVPTTVWLFGSGLLGMVGIARRRKAA
jgi:hypothetical protein